MARREGTGPEEARGRPRLPGHPRLAALLCLALLWPAAAWTQPTGRRYPVSGVVTGPSEEPVAGARVVLRLDEDGTELPAVETGGDGRWLLVAPRPGRWTIEIRATGYLDVEGWTEVDPALPTPPVEVEMRSLDEVSPGGYEGNPVTLRRWIEKGNVLLEQGRSGAARAEYEKALPLLPIASRPEVLRAVARTHYVEGDVEAALEALRRALALDRADADTRQLFSVLMRELGRGEEAENWLAALDRGEIAADFEPPPAGGAWGGLPPELAALPVEPPRAGRVGRYRTTFEERSPLSGLAVFRQRFALEQDDVEAADPAGGAYDLAAETFHVYVPEIYEPAAGYGLLVWISPTPFGGFVSPEMRAALDAHRLVWIGADNAGNARARWYRVGLALDAAYHMQRLYDLDPERVVVAGYSGGGRVASGAAMHYPEVFGGALCLYGVDYFRPLAVPDKPGASWPPRFPPPPEEQLAERKRETRFVLVTGELDFNRPQTKQAYRAMLADGFERARYLEVPGASHYTRLTGAWLDRALHALLPEPAGG